MKKWFIPQRVQKVSDAKLKKHAWKNQQRLENGLPELSYQADVEYYYFRVPYSFVMGVFNYLSSLMHAAVQMYIKFQLEKELKNTEIHESATMKVRLTAFAHSDDSAGKLMVRNKTDLARAFNLYTL